MCELIKQSSTKTNSLKYQNISNDSDEQNAQKNVRHMM